MKGLAAIENKTNVIHENGYTEDIMAVLLSQDNVAASQTKYIAATFYSDNDIKSTCKKIYNYVKQNVKYTEDKGQQDVRLPSRLIHDAQGDCKSMSLFCAGVLKNLGIPYSYRFVSQNKNDDFHHVFIVVKDEAGENIYLDCVEDYFNKYYRYEKIIDYTPRPTAKKIAGIGATTIGTGKPNMDAVTTASGNSYTGKEAYDLALAINPNPYLWETDDRIYTKEYFKIAIDHYFLFGYHLSSLYIKTGSQQYITEYNACKALNPATDKWATDPRISDTCKIGHQMKQWQIWRDAKTVATIDNVRYRDYDNYLKDWKTIHLPIYEKEMDGIHQKLKKDAAWLIAGSILSAGMTAFDPNYGAWVKLCVQIGGLNQDGTGNFGVKGAFKENTFHQLIYNYWDETKCPFPARLADKRKQAQDLHQAFFKSKMNRRYVQSGNIQPYFSEFNLRLFCDVHCLNIYGMTADMLLQKMYNYEKYGTEMLVVQGTPYWNKKTNRWEMNGANQQNMLLLIYSMVASTSTSFRPYGVPYWSVGGFIMPNGADAKTIANFTAIVPKPKNLGITEGIINPDPALQERAKAYYTNNILPYYSPLGYTHTATLGAGKPSMNGKAAIGIAPAVIAAIISAVVTILTLVLGIVAEEQKKQKKSEAQVNKDKYEPHTDFPQNYTTVDNCYIEQSATGNVKICQDGTVEYNVNLNDPQNQPSAIVNQTSGAPAQKKKTAMLLIAATGVAAAFVLTTDKAKASIKGIFKRNKK